MKKATDYIGSLVIENDTLQFIQTAEGRVVPKTVDGVDKNEYQYHLKDHLGNVRTTFAVREDEYSTNFETGINPYFDNYDQITILSNPLKRSGNYAHRLTGGGTNIVGLIKSLYVSKGDKITAEVYGKYLNAQFADEGINGAALINALVSMLGGGTLTGEGNLVENTLNTDFISAAAADGSEETSPKAYLNYILLDQNFNYLNSGFDRLGESAADPGDGTGAHQKLSFEEILIEEDGYLMVFVSNESEQSVEVFWDDFRVDHHYNAVLQADDYYPFGLTFNSYQRSYSKANNYKYNGFEEQVEWGVYDYQARYYDPALGRFLNVDPLSDLIRRHSPYNYAYDNPIRFIDPDGMMPSDVVDPDPPSKASRTLSDVGEGFSMLLKITTGKDASEIYQGLSDGLQYIEDKLITENQVNDVAANPEKTELSGSPLIGKMNGDGAAIQGYGAGNEIDVSIMQNLLGVSMRGGAPEALGERISTAVSGGEKLVESVGATIDEGKKLKARFVKNGDQVKFLDSISTSTRSDDTLTFQNLKNSNAWGVKKFEDL